MINLFKYSQTVGLFVKFYSVLGHDVGYRRHMQVQREAQT
jgi:hypothetical protein